MSSSLPLCAAFLSKSSGKYLQCHADDTELLQLRGDDAVDPYTRFYIEPSTKHDGLVHVRCCYNNKYLVAQQHPNDNEWWIAGAAHELEDDMSLQSCTLFQLKTEGEDTDTIRFVHSQLGKHCGVLAESNGSNGAFQGCMHTIGEEQSESFTLVNLPPRALPHVVCIKGDNGQYLTIQTINGVRRLIFSAKNMVDDIHTWFATLTGNNGTAIRFRANTQGWFWRWRAPINSDPHNWVLADFSAAATDPNNVTSFVPVFFGDGQIIGLRSLANNLYCKRFTTSIITHGLAAMDVNTAARVAEFEWQEPVASRLVHDIRFDLGKARVYNEQPLVLATASATNDTASTRTEKLTFEFVRKETRRWSSSMSLKSPVVVTINSQVPSKVDQRRGMMVGPGHFNGMYSWGATNESSLQETVVRFVDLPGKTKLTATLSAIRSSYDVPFSYSQHNRFVTGTVTTTTFLDGIFSGQNVNSLDYNYKTEKN